MKTSLPRVLVIVALLAFACGATRAATITWTNVSGGNWSVANNWLPHQVPGAGDTAEITADGTYTVTLNVAATVTRLTLGGVGGTQTLANSSQTLTLNAASTVNAHGVVSLSGGVLGGPGDLTVDGPFQWSGGTIGGTGTLFANGGLTLTGAALKTLTGRTLVNSGAASWSAGQLNLSSGAILSNALTGTFDCAFDGPMAINAGTGQTVANAGHFRKTAGAGATTINFPIAFNNTGTVEVQSGTLRLNGGGTNTGDFTTVNATTLELGGGTHTLTAGNLTGAGAFAVSGGTANFGAAVSLTSTFSVSGGTANLSGAATPAQLNVSGGVLGGTGDLTVAGPFQWTGGTINGSGTTFANGGLSLTGPALKTLTGRTLVNSGAASWSAGQFNLASGGILSNALTGTFDCEFDGNIVALGTGQAVANAGRFRKTAGAGATTITFPIAFNNTGTVEVQSGTLRLNGGGTNTGDFTTVNATTLELGGGTHTLTAGNLTGAGAFAVSGGTANFGAAVSLTSTFSVSGGTANLSGAATPAQLNVSGGVLGGTGDLTVAGPFQWTGGTINGSGTTFANGGLSLTGPALKTLTGRTLVNSGAASWSAGQFNLTSGGILSNALTGTFDCEFDGNIVALGTGQAVANAGRFRKTAGAGATAITVPIAFNNTGTVEVQSGTLRLSGGGTSTGDFTTVSGTTLDLGGGTHTLTGCNLTGAGTFAVSGGTANFDPTVSLTSTFSVSGGTANLSGAITPAQLNVSGGTLGGTGDLTVAGPVQWTGGTISGSGTTFANGGLALTGQSLKTLTGRTLVNSGAASWSAGQFILANGGILSNALTGTFDCEFDGIMAAVGTGQAVANAGHFRKTAGVGATTINAPIAFNNTGTVEVQSGTLRLTGTSVQTAGLMLLDGGDLAVTQPFQLLGGTLSGTNTVFGSVTNSGVVSPGASPGRLTITGAYTQTANGALNIELAGASAGNTFDQLIVSNTVVLAGALNVTLTNGFYPAPDFIFTNVVRATSRSGTFATFSFPSNIVGLQLNHGTTNVDIEVINTLPIVPTITDKTVDELTLLSLNAGASDGDAPAQTLSYSLINSPANASIDPNGLLTWMPAEAQGPLTTDITVLVTDNGTPNLTTTNTFRVVVNEINVAPVLTLPPNQALNELTAFSASATATDADLPVNPLTFQLVSGPPGLTVSTSGAIAWTPGESQGPDTYTVTVRVTDSNPAAVNEQQLSHTSSFTLTVNEVNLPPDLPAPGTQTLNELALLTVANPATDPDLPANGLVYALVSGPTGVVVNPASGVLTWTPDESQGASTNVIQVKVTDTNPLAVNATSISTTNSFTVIVREVNVAPVLTLPADQTIDELVPYSSNATATDADLPANALAFALVSGPTGMAVNPASGAITWTPSEVQGGAAHVVQISVTDTNPLAAADTSLSVTNSFTLTVREVNAAPVLTLPADQTIDELVPYSSNATASDTDMPANALTFALVSGPAGMAVDAASGAITWTPSEAQGATTNTVRIKVTDDGSPSLSTTNSYLLTVHEVNLAPVVGPLTDRTADAGQTITFTATVTDADLPADTLSFSLISPPAGATIVAGSGLFHWRVPVALAGSTQVLRVHVTDNGTPNLSGTNTFTVTVKPMVPVVLTALDHVNGEFRLNVTGSPGPDYILQGSDTLIDFIDIATNTPAVLPFIFTDANPFSGRFYRVRLSP